jgi:hypothetical protein
MTMKGKQLLYAMAMVGAVAMMSASSASAQFVPLPNSYTFLGMVGNQGKLVSFNPSTGQCASTNVGLPGGLNANVTIFGTAATDAIFIVSTPTSQCGLNMTTLVTNGRTVTIRAGAQGDWIDAGAFAFTTLVGDSGPDIIVHASFNGALWGTGEDDLMIGSTNCAFRGEAGNDTMCAGAGTSVERFDGGSGADTHCGMSAIIVSSSPSCTPC